MDPNAKDPKVKDPKKPHSIGPDKGPRGSKGPIGKGSFGKGAVPRPRINKGTNRGR